MRKSQNMTTLLYHLVFPAKWGRAVLDSHVDGVAKEVCAEAGKRYDVRVLESRRGADPVSSAVESIPRYGITKMVTILRTLTPRETFKRYPETEEELGGV